MKCKSCGYHKNDPGQPNCNLCGATLEPEPEPYGGGGGYPAGGGEMNFGTGVRGASRQVQTRNDGPRDDQIVYAGDFAIVYVFALNGGELIILKPGEVFTFGRNDNADHKVDSKQVSRRHARIHWSGVDPPVPEVVDLDSKNGILVNGVPVKRKVLEDGDELRLGPFSATLRVMSANVDLQMQLQTDRMSATAASSQRLAGEVKLIPIPWLLQHLERIKESGTLTVQHGAERGYVAFISGVAIAAGYGPELETTGEEAIAKVAKLRQGRFALSPGANVAPQSIKRRVGEIIGPPPGRRGPPRGGPRRPPPGGRPPRRPPSGPPGSGPSGSSPSGSAPALPGSSGDAEGEPPKKRTRRIAPPKPRRPPR